MSTTIDIRELPGRLEEALNLASAGNEVILVDGSKPRARLTSISPPSRRPGLHPGAIEAASDFDEPLGDDFWVGEK